MKDIDVLMFLVPRVIVATLCGGIIGWERGMKNKVAGIRTHVIVCVGACLFTSTGFIFEPSIHVDPTRAIGQIITGIGFLGAGVIFKQEDKVIGVTSAAFIWLISSIGVLIGMGYLITSLFFTSGLLVSLLMLQRIEEYFKDKQK